MRSANTRNNELIRQISKEDQATLTLSQDRDMYLFYPEDYFKRSGYPMNARPQDYYNEEGVTLKRNAEKKLNMDEYKRFNENVDQQPYYNKANKIPLKAETLSQVSTQGKVLSAANLDKFSKAPSHMASTKSQAESRGLKKALSKSGISRPKSGISGSKFSGKSRTLKSVKSQRTIKNKNDTKTVKTIKIVKAADILNLINVAKLSEKIEGNGVDGDLNENQADQEESELIYLD